VVAELAGRRSTPQMIADRVRLALEPTRRVTGRLDLAGIPVGSVHLFSADEAVVGGRFVVVAPVAADGAFSLDRVGTGAVRIGVEIDTGWSGEAHDLATLPASIRPVSDLQLAFEKSDRRVDVVARSAVDAPIDAVEVNVLSGNHAVERIRNLGDLDRIQAASTQSHYAAPQLEEPGPGPLSGKVKAGELVAHFEHVRPGALTVCAYTIGAEPIDSASWERLRDHGERVAVKCAAVGSGENLVVIDVPPQQRLE
jgi:hypothetical protein